MDKKSIDNYCDSLINEIQLLQQQLHNANELIDKLSIAPELAHDAGYLKKEKELILLINNYKQQTNEK